MDNDDLRRGRPTCHKAFDEATAVLAGDGLLTAAFETAGRRQGSAGGDGFAVHPHPGPRRGHERHDRGQVLDMGAEHRKISLDELRLLQSLKTGCLLWAACELGCTAAGRTDAQTIEKAHTYGEKLGLAFQIQDDLLDIEGDAAVLGKPPARMRGTKNPPSVAFRGGGMPPPGRRADRAGGRRGRGHGGQRFSDRACPQSDGTLQVNLDFYAVLLNNESNVLK